jgi:hypothetical protein
LINWQRWKAIVFESDDWGACSWVPDEKTYEKLRDFPFMQRKGVKFFSCSTLETSQHLKELFEVLSSFKGDDGRKVIWQANYVVANPDFEAIEKNNFSFYLDHPLPNFPSRWERKGFLSTVREGEREEIWYPEYHGRAHFDYLTWLNLLKRGDKVTQKTFAEEVSLTWNERESYEYPNHISSQQRLSFLLTGLKYFQQIFGRKPTSTVAPDYFWSEDEEGFFSQNKFQVIQAKNLQISSPSPKKMKNLTYLSRYLHFEPAAGSDRVAKEVFQNILKEWKKNRPAIISSHRANYTHLTPKIRQKNLTQLKNLLYLITTQFPEAVFLVDTEIAQIYKQGYSRLDLEKGLIYRNFTEGEVELKIRVDFKPVAIISLKTGAEVKFVQETEEKITTSLEPGHYLIKKPEKNFPRRQVKCSLLAKE